MNGRITNDGLSKHFDLNQHQKTLAKAYKAL